MSKQRLAIGLMIAQAALFSAETAMVHQVGGHASVTQLSLLRSLAGLSVVALLAHRLRGVGWWLLKTDQLWLQLLRGVISFAYLWVMMLSFRALPFADATAISYTQALYVAGFSVLILNERVSVLRWGAAAIGCFGALLIVRPGFADWNLIYPIALVGTGLNGAAFVLNKYLQRPGGDSELTTMFFVNVVPLVCNLPFALTAPLPPAAAWPWLSGVVLFGPLGVYTGIVALRHANAAILGPYTFLRLLIAVVAGAVIFHEAPDPYALFGAALIVMSCLCAAVPDTWQKIVARRPRQVTQADAY